MGTELAQDPALQPTGHICADCGENIVYTQEAWLLSVVHPQKVGKKHFFHAVINEEDVDGSFLFDPYYYCFTCWESVYEEIKEESKDEPPVLDSGISEFECSCCGSGIREGEYAGTLSLGEFHVSKRAPSGVHGPYFKTITSPDLLCLYCLVLLNEGHIEMWEDLTQFGECNDCIQLRCWRHGACGCGCHTEEQEEEQVGELT